MPIASFPQLALAERALVDIQIEYATGDVDGNGEAITMYAESNVDYWWAFADAGLTTVWIQTSETFWQDPVRVIAVFDDMGVTEMYPFTDANGSDWLSLTGSESIAFSAQAIADDGTPLLSQRLIMSPKSQAQYEFETGTVVGGTQGDFGLFGGEDAPPTGGDGLGDFDFGDDTVGMTTDEISFGGDTEGDDYLPPTGDDGLGDFDFGGGEDAPPTGDDGLGDFDFGGEEDAPPTGDDGLGDFDFGGDTEGDSYLPPTGDDSQYASDPLGDANIGGTDGDENSDADSGFSFGDFSAMNASGVSTLSEPEINPLENNPVAPPVYESVYGYTTSETTPLMADTAADALKITDLALGTYTRLSDLVEDPVILVDGVYWLAVTLESDHLTTGYIRYDEAAYLFLTAQEETTYLSGVREQMPSDMSDYLNITGGGVSLFGSAGGMATSQASQAQKLVLNITDATPLAWDASHRLWIPVYVEDSPTQSGYILYAKGTAGVQLMTQAEKSTYEQSKAPKDKEQFPSTPESNFGQPSSNGTVVYADVNGQQVATVGINDVLVMKETAQSPIKWDDDDKMWIPVESYKGDVKGYIKMTSFSFYTAEQEKSFIAGQTPVDTPSDEPLPIYASLYAQIASIGTTLHGRDLSQTGTLSGGAYVIFQASAADQTFVDANHDRWMLVKLDDSSTTGYVRNSAMTFLTKEQETTYLAGKGTTPKTDTSKYAYVNARNVNVRSSPNSTAQITAQVTQGDGVFLNDLVVATDGTNWYQATLIEKAGTPKPTGYIRSDMVDIMTEAQEIAYLKAHPTEDVSTAPAKTNAPTLPPLTAGYMRATVQNAPMVSFPSVGGTVSSVLSVGDAVYVYWQEHDESHNLFHYAYNLKDGKFGYVLARYMAAMSTQEINEYIRSQNPTTAPTTAPTYSPSSFSGYALLTSNKVNFRSAASSSGSVITQLSQGTIVRVISETSGDGYTWYRCESGGSTGYLRGDMLSLLTISQYQTIVSLPSYSNSGGSIITPTATANTGGVNAGTWATQRPSVSSTITFVTIPPATTADPSASASANPSASADPAATVDPSASPTATDGLPGAELTPLPLADATLSAPEPDATFPTQETGGFSAPSLLIALVVLLVLASGGFYGYSVYNKARRKQAQEQSRRLAEEARRKARQAEADTGAKPAVRRPVPPPAAPGTQAAAKPGDPSADSPAAGQAPRTDAARQSPYMRPQGQQPVKPPVRDVASTAPRAQVDGRPVTTSSGKPSETPRPGEAPRPGETPRRGETPRPGGAQPSAGAARTAPGAQAASQRPDSTSTPPNPYSRPADGTSPVRTQESAPPTRQRMPIAPSPVEPDGEPTPTPRRRRRHVDSD